MVMAVALHVVRPLHWWNAESFHSPITKYSNSQDGRVTLRNTIRKKSAILSQASRRREKRPQPPARHANAWRYRINGGVLMFPLGLSVGRKGRWNECRSVICGAHGLMQTLISARTTSGLSSPPGITAPKKDMMKFAVAMVQDGQRRLARPEVMPAEIDSSAASY